VRLPFDTRVAGDVVTPVKLLPGVVAHRGQSRYETTKARKNAPERRIEIVWPACLPEAEATGQGRFFKVSAGWADKHGAVGCLEEACWRDAPEDSAAVAGAAYAASPAAKKARRRT